MERRKLLAVGGVLSVTAFATTVGLGATFGLFGLTQPDSAVGRLGGPPPAEASASEQTSAQATPGAVPTDPRALPDDGADD
jgi:hypothetical protein